MQSQEAIVFEAAWLLLLTIAYSSYLVHEFLGFSCLCKSAGIIDLCHLVHIFVRSGD